MIVNVRGGCGSGKSTIVRHFVSTAKTTKEIMRPWAKKPVGYVLDDSLFVPGHYEIANGGLDTIGDLDRAHRLIRHYYERGMDVLFEGMNQKRDIDRVTALNAVIVVLTTPNRECIASVRKRGHTRHESYILATCRKAVRDAIAFEKAGLEVNRLARAEALELVKEKLKWTS